MTEDRSIMLDCVRNDEEVCMFYDNGKCSINEVNCEYADDRS